MKAYGLDQQRPSNIGIESSKLETQVLAYQYEQTLQLIIVKEEPQELDQEIAHTKLAKKELQKFDHQ